MQSQTPRAQPFTHAQARFEERFSLEVSMEDLQELADMVRDRTSDVKVQRQTMSVLMEYEVLCEGKRFGAVYNPYDRKLVRANQIIPRDEHGRTGLPVKQAVQARIIELIQARASAVTLVRQFLSPCLECRVSWRGREFDIVYAPKQHRIITVLPKATGSRYKKSKLLVRSKVRGNPRSARMSYVDEDEDDDQEVA